MIRFLINVGLQLAAAAVGLIVAAVLVEGIRLEFGGLVLALVVFTAATAILQPFVMKMTVKNAQAFMGASAIVTTFLGLLITTVLTNGLRIDGADSWLVGTLVVWLATVIATLVIPFVLVKAGVQRVREAREGN
jgi:hypothetical protein